MIQDGKYIVKRELNGEKSTLGKFLIENGVLSFPVEKDYWNIGLFEPGPITKYVEDKISYLMTDKDKDVYIEKV